MIIVKYMLISDCENKYPYSRIIAMFVYIESKNKRNANSQFH